MARRRALTAIPFLLAAAAAAPTSVAQTAEADAARDREIEFIRDRGNIRERLAPGSTRYALEEAYLEWPLAPEDQAYAAIDGAALKRHVEALAAIAREYRDSGNPQYWGRIIGTEGDAATARWLEAEFRRIGLVNVRSQMFDLPEMTLPDRWRVSVSGGATPLELSSALAVGGIVATLPSGAEAPAAYVGMGDAADFRGRDVAGKAVFIYAVPRPSAFVTSATVNQAVERAEAAGAATVFLILGMAENITAFTGCETKDIPCFVIGEQDGGAVREAIEASPADRPPLVSFTLSTRPLVGATTAQVWGELPGATDETIVVIAHRDGYFEGAMDNASGVATMLGLAEYFSRMPQSQRRRRLVFVGTPGHHAGGHLGTRWMAENAEEVFGRTALLINAEHTAYTEAANAIDAMRRSNAPGPHNWFVGGGPALEAIAIGAWRDFGVPTLALPDSRPPGDAALIWQLAPMVQIISGAWMFHTGADSPDQVPAPALAASTRAYAKMIDEVNRLEIDELRTAAEPAPMP